MPVRFRLRAFLSSSGLRVSVPAPATAARLAARTPFLSQPRIFVSWQVSRMFSGGTKVTATDRSVKIASSEAAKRVDL